MKPDILNILVIDDNKLMAGTLSKYLNDRFGTKVNVSFFFDEESCVQMIDEHSQVIVLDYFLNKDEKKSKNGLGIYNSIKKRSPGTEVTMITSNEDISEAIQEMERGVSDYIFKREKIESLFNRMILSPINVRFVLPIRRIIAEYSLKDYLVMFIIAFISVGTLVFVGLKIFR